MKFLKKLLCLSTAAVMLSGCELVDTSDDLVISNTSFVPVSQTEEVEENVIETDVSQTEDPLAEKDPEAIGWELRDILLYSVNGSSTLSTYDPSGEELRLVKPGVTYNYDQMNKFVNDNGYFKKHYMMSKTIRDNAEYADFGEYGQHAKAFVEQVIGGQKVENYSKEEDVTYSDMIISIGQDYNTYDEPNFFSITLNSTAATYGFQQALYELLAEQIGKETAEYVVYARTIVDGVPEMDLKDVIPSEDGGGNLVVTRKITSGSFSLELDFQAYAEFSEDRFAYYDHAYKPFYNTCKFSLSDVFQGDFGGNDPTNDMQFFNTFMKSGGTADSGFTRTLKDNCIVIANEGNNKINRSYRYNMRIVKGCNMDVEDAPFLNCDITAYFDSRINRNFINGNGSFIAGYIPFDSCSEEEAMNQLYGVAREKLACLFPCVDANDLEYNGKLNRTVTRSGYFTSTSYMVPVNVTISFTPSIRYNKITDDDGNTFEDKESPLYYYILVGFDLT